MFLTHITGTQVPRQSMPSHVISLMALPTPLSVTPHYKACHPNRYPDSPSVDISTVLAYAIPYSQNPVPFISELVVIDKSEVGQMIPYLKDRQIQIFLTIRIDARH